MITLPDIRSNLYLKLSGIGTYRDRSQYHQPCSVLLETPQTNHKPQPENQTYLDQLTLNDPQSQIDIILHSIEL